MIAKNTLRISVLFIFVSLFAVSRVQSQTLVSAQNDLTSFYDMSLTDLMNMEIGVASQKPLPQRESPGIVTLITEEEIKNAGASDLIDVLRLVPGIQFGCDVQGVVGIAVRGNWAHEGKALLLWDGHPMNENLYSSMQFGNHYPVDRIKRIEIIRGPGSAIYGGYAEYAVINIISKSDKEFNGIDASALYGQTKNTFSHRNVTLSAGRTRGDFSCNVSLFAGEGNRSDRNYTDNNGASYNMANNSKLNPMLGEMNLAWKNFSASAIFDNYYTTSRDEYIDAMQTAYPIAFNSYSVLTKYVFELKNKFKVTPVLSFRHDLPWNTTELPVNGDDHIPYNMVANRSTFNVTASKDLNEKNNLLFGGEMYSDRGINQIEGKFFANGKSEIKYNNYAAFAQGMFRTSLANFTVGARYHCSDKYPSSFVPRLAVTKAFAKTYFKLLFSKAFRTPSIENLNYGVNIKPEKTTTVEFETGCNINDFWSLAANVFDITTIDPIIYFYETLDGYKNGTENGTRGFELSSVYKNKNLHVLASYSFYTTAGKNSVDDYLAETGKNYVLAFPNHKINVTLNLNISRRVNLCYVHYWQSERQSFAGTDIDGNKIFTTHTPIHQGNISCGIKNIFTRGITLGFGINNVLDSEIIYIQPYNGGHAPLPGLSREYRLTLSYNLSFGSN